MVGAMTVELEALARQAVDGDGAALREVCRALEGPVFRLCLRLLGDVRDAEDAAQDVLVKVVTNLSAFEGRSALTTWVQRIAVRHVLSVKQSRAEVRALDEDGFAALLEQGLAFAATQPPLSAEDRVLLKEVRLGCTQGMLMMLSREERLALVLVELLGFDGAEAAELLEVGHDAFRQRLTRARQRLGTFLEARCGVANEKAACRCEPQTVAKRALGLSVASQRFTPLSTGDASAGREVLDAQDELAHVRAIASAFHRDGLFTAPGSLRTRLETLLPTVLAAPVSRPRGD
jgi:RNA polymerase sigma factor (sigma-70 family)